MAPAREYVPALQAKHACPSVRYDPAGHTFTVGVVTVGNGVAVVAAAVLHAVAPALTVPEQVWHALWPTMELNWPAGHNEHAMAPVEADAVPAAHGKQPLGSDADT